MKNEDVSPNEVPKVANMRSDLERIKKMIDDCTTIEGKFTSSLGDEVNILRELLTSWQAMTQAEYQTDNKLHLNILTKRMLNHE